MVESLIYNSVQRSVNNIIINEQHEFRPGRLTSTSNFNFTKYVMPLVNIFKFMLYYNINITYYNYI